MVCVRTRFRVVIRISFEFILLFMLCNSFSVYHTDVSYRFSENRVAYSET